MDPRRRLARHLSRQLDGAEPFTIEPAASDETTEVTTTIAVPVSAEPVAAVTTGPRLRTS